MIGRVSVEPFELPGIFGRTVLGDPELCDLEVLVAQHVEQRYLAYYRPKKIGPLSNHGTHQKAAVRAALNRKMVFIGVLLRDQIFAGGDEVAKNVLLFLQHAGAM